MEAQEFVTRYRAGERDFPKVELLGATLSEADLRDINHIEQFVTRLLVASRKKRRLPLYRDDGE